MAPDMLQPTKLLQHFYSMNAARLNNQEEALISLVTFDQEKSTPTELIYWVDDCIKEGSQPFKAIINILATLLGEVLSEISDGAAVAIHGQAIHFMPVIDMGTLEQIIKKLHKINPFGNFSFN